MKDDILISIDQDKEPYIKNITNDKIINLTGESGSGKTYYSKKWYGNSGYVVIDTDEVFARYEKSSGINKELGTMFRSKYQQLPSLFTDFEMIYEDILDYCKDMDKTIIIDSAQYRNVKDVSKIKGQIIIMRTSINTCYNRCIQRYLAKKPNATEEELNEYKNKKKNMYDWYKALNEFIKKIDSL